MNKKELEEATGFSLSRLFDIMSDYKKCGECLEIKEKKYYNTRIRNNKVVPLYVCKSCESLIAKRYYEKNHTKVLEKCNAKMKKGRESLSDAYLRAVIRQKFGIYAKDVTDHMIKIERVLITARRELKELNKRGKECQTN